MKDYKVLKFLDLFKGVFEKFHIDYSARKDTTSKVIIR